MKYMGSKARIVKDILPIILENRKFGQMYIEPFAGGMNSMCAVKGNRIANDNHYYLIEMWKSLSKGWIPEKISRETYEAIRKNPWVYSPALVGWVGFNCSYSGKWWGGYAGDTKTKIGTIRDYQSEAITNVLKQVPFLYKVLFLSMDYRQLYYPKNSIIYCDPPYANTTKYKDDFDHTAFWDWVRTMHNDGHQIFVSEYNAPDDFTCIWEKEVKSSLSANGNSGGNKLSTERLFKIV